MSCWFKPTISVSSFSMFHPAIFPPQEKGRAADECQYAADLRQSV
jgi:hypothetical protein